MLAIEVLNLSKSFHIYAKPFDRIKERLALNQKQLHKTFWALKNISFSIKKGASVGIIGQNGSGKSTLLKILAGLMMPSDGEVKVHGKISSLIELGMGFHPEFTGRANVYLYSALLGMQKEEIEAKFNGIVEFSGIGEFIDRPVKIYSTGMYLRLAFSVAISVNPDILIIDEVLSVGDALFSQKCIKKLREFQEQGVTILFVSHDMGVIKNLCQEAILLDQGKLVERGAPEDISDYYMALIQKRYAEEMKQFTLIRTLEGERDRKRQRYGNFDAMISEINLLNLTGEEIGGVRSGEACIIVVKVLFFEDVENAVIGILIRDRLGNEVFGTNTGFHNQQIGCVRKDEMIFVKFSLAMNIGPGDYTITAAVHPDPYGLNGHFDWIDRAVPFKVFPTEPRFIGLSKLNPEIELRRLKITDPLRVDYSSPLKVLFPNAKNYLEMDESGQPYLVKGWHAPEIWTEGSVRWTAKESVFILKVSSRKIWFEFFSSKPDIEKDPVIGDIFCNGRKIGYFYLGEHGWKRLDYEIEEKLIGEVARFKLILNRTWCPDHYYRNGDKRELGVAVRRIWCES